MEDHRGCTIGQRQCRITNGRSFYTAHNCHCLAALACQCLGPATNTIGWFRNGARATATVTIWWWWSTYMRSAVDTNRLTSSYGVCAPDHSIGRCAEDSNRSAAVETAGCFVSPDASEDYAAASSSSARFASKSPETLPRVPEPSVGWESTHLSQYRAKLQAFEDEHLRSAVRIVTMWCWFAV